MWHKFLKRITNLPLSKGDFGAFIPYMIAFFVFLSALGIMMRQGVQHQVSIWENALQDAVTVQVFAPQETRLESFETFQKDMAEKTKRVEAFLRTRSEIRDFETLSTAQTSSLLKPWLGDMPEIVSLTMPTLIKVRPAHFDGQILGHLKTTLQQEFDGVNLDYKNVWIENLVSAGKNFMYVMTIVLACFTGLIAFMIVFLTRIGFILHRKNAEILSLMGGSRAYIRKQFLRYIVFRTLQGFMISFFLLAPFALLPHYFKGFTFIDPIVFLPYLGGLYVTALFIVWITSFATIMMNVKKLA